MKPYTYAFTSSCGEGRQLPMRAHEDREGAIHWGQSLLGNEVVRALTSGEDPVGASVTVFEGSNQFLGAWNYDDEGCMVWAEGQ